MPDVSPDIAARLSSAFSSAWYLRTDDNLRVTSYNALASVRLELRYRMLDLNDNIVASQEAQVPNTDRTAKSTIFVTPDGWLLGGEVFVSGAAPLIGQTYVVVEIVRGLGSSALPLQVIAAGYVSAKQPLPFPGVQISSSLDGGGALRSITGSTPGAGGEISETVPTGARWQLLTFSAQLAASATVANRIPTLIIDDGATSLSRSSSQVNQPASNTWIYSWSGGFTSTNLGATSNVSIPLMTPAFLNAGYRVRTGTSGLQVGDQYSAVQYLVREWLEGA